GIKGRAWPELGNSTATAIAITMMSPLSLTYRCLSSWRVLPQKLNSKKHCGSASYVNSRNGRPLTRLFRRLRRRAPHRRALFVGGLERVERRHGDGVVATVH